MGNFVCRRRVRGQRPEPAFMDSRPRRTNDTLDWTVGDGEEQDTSYDDELVVLAVDVGGTKTAVGLVTTGGRLVDWLRASADASRGPEPMVDDYVRMARALLDRHSVARDRLCAVGAGCGGPLDADTGIVYSPPN